MSSLLEAFTVFHVALSLIGIVAGFAALAGMIGATWKNRWVKIFLWATSLTSITGFMFPFRGITKGIVLGIISLVVLALGLYALYGKKVAGGWRATFVISLTIAQYLNFFVLIAQAFRKIPALTALAPTGAETPFKVVQGVTLLIFIALGILAVRNFRDKAPLKA